MVEDVVRTQSYMNVILNTISYIDVHVYIYIQKFISYEFVIKHKSVWILFTTQSHMELINNIFLIAFR